MTEPSPPRLHVLLARDVPLGVVIRRGPSKVTATFLWDRETDTFTLGQWVKARIYERRSDLSPDGKHLLYFALTGFWHLEAKGSYTAISRAPYLKAVSFYAQGDAWNGGGLWVDDRQYWLNESPFCPPTPVREAQDLIRAERDHYPQIQDEEVQSYIRRLQRDGWFHHRWSEEGGWRTGHFRKDGPCGWMLEKLFPGRRKKGAPVYMDEHRLVYEGADVVLYPDWEWADMDRGRLVWATEGRIETGVPTEKGMVDVRVLHDFNGMTFRAVKAPY